MNGEPGFNFEALPLWAQIMLFSIAVLSLKMRRFRRFACDAVENFRRNIK